MLGSVVSFENGYIYTGTYKQTNKQIRTSVIVRLLNTMWSKLLHAHLRV